MRCKSTRAWAPGVLVKTDAPVQLLALFKGDQRVVNGRVSCAEPSGGGRAVPVYMAPAAAHAPSPVLKHAHLERLPGVCHGVYSCGGGKDGASWTMYSVLTECRKFCVLAGRNGIQCQGLNRVLQLFDCLACIQHLRHHVRHDTSMTHTKCHLQHYVFGCSDHPSTRKLYSYMFHDVQLRYHTSR